MRETEPAASVSSDHNIEGKKRRIATILDGLEDSELARLESILEQFEQPTPSEEFALEKIDDNWSLEEQTKLELDAFNVHYVALTRAVKGLYVIGKKDKY